MHETVIANNIIEEAKKQGDVAEIFLEIGELAHVPADDLLETLKRLVTWIIHSKNKPAVVRCNCGFEGHPEILDRGHDFFLIECPACKEVPEIIDGKDITITKVVVK